MNTIVTANYDFGERTTGDTVGPMSLAITRNGDPEDLTGVVVSFRLVDPSLATKVGALAVELTNDAGITIVDNIVTLARFVVPSSVGVYRHDITFTYPDGSVRTYLRGTLTAVRGL